MTYQDKAKDIYVKYLELFPDGVYSDEGARYTAKLFALICVEEILNANPIVPLEYMLESEALDKAREYWQSVKTEIEKL